MNEIISLPNEPPEYSLLRLMIEKGADPSAIEKMVTLVERMEDRRAKERFMLRKTKFQRICPPIAKTKEAGGQNSRWKYAGWDEIGPIVAPHLAECEIAVAWSELEVVYPTADSTLPPLMSGACILAVGAYSERYPMSGFPIPYSEMKKGHANEFAFGAADSYFKRRSFNNAMGIIITDEDNEQYLLSQDPQIDDDERGQLDEVILQLHGEDKAGIRRCFEYMGKVAGRTLERTADLRRSEFKKILPKLQESLEAKKARK